MVKITVDEPVTELKIIVLLFVLLYLDLILAPNPVSTRNSGERSILEEIFYSGVIVEGFADQIKVEYRFLA